MVETFGARLATRVGERGALCVGVDPSARLLESWGRADSVEGVEFAARALVEAVADVATAVKVQVAYFERFAAAGYRVLERVVAEARDADLLVVADVKRGDIPSTNEGYAQAWLGGGPLGVDAMTVSPFLGVGSLAPFVGLAHENSRGVFVLAATSNDEGRRFQSARTDVGEPLEEAVLDFAAGVNSRDDGRGPSAWCGAPTATRRASTSRTSAGRFSSPGSGPRARPAPTSPGCSPGARATRCSRTSRARWPPPVRSDGR